MSIFVSQPHKRVRRLSGLGAYAELAPYAEVARMSAMAPTPMYHHAGRATGTAPMAPMSMRYASPPQRTARMRGLGQLVDPRSLRMSTSLPSIQSLSPAAVQQMQQTVHQQVASQQANLVTFDTSSSGDAQPMPTASFTIEGALPGGVALLLGGALGLLGASMIFGGK